MDPLERRDFIGGVAAAGLASTLSGQTSSGGMIYRTLGSTGERVSAIGLGGAHIGKIKDEAESVRLMRTAVDRGLTFFDNSWDYNKGVSEVRMGKALRDGYRAKVFLMTKFDGRTRESAAQQIDESLARLGTDHLDLLQFHENIRLEDPDRFFAPGGAVEALTEARKAGKTRFIGFTGHKDPQVHLRMLQMADERGFRFDTLQMPLNVMDAHFRSFAKNVLPILVQKKMGILGMKSMGDKIILNSNTVKPIECLHYALNLPTSVVITGIDTMEILDQAFEAARTFKPMDQTQVNSLLSRTSAAAAKGEFELFKTSNKFDSTAQHPDWLGNAPSA